MKAFKTVLITIAVLVVLVGGILLGIGIKNQDFSKTYGEIVDTIYEPKDEFNDISIKGDVSDFEIVKSDEDKVRITCHESEKVYSTVSVSNNTLHIDQKDTRAWYEKITWFVLPNTRKLTVTIYLPKTDYQKLSFDIATGDLCLKDVSFENLSVKTSTGDITFDNVKSSLFSASTSTGNIKVYNVDVLNTLDIRANTGDVLLENVNATDAIIKTATGNETLKNVISTHTLKLQASTGDIRFTCIDSKSITLKTSTGDIKGDILTPKTFTTNKKHAVVPQTTGDECIAETSVGDIRITISNN